MGLSWQQGPLAPGAVGRFLVPDPLPERLLFAEPLRRRMRVRFGEAGSPTARTSCCCTSPAATRWPTSRSATIAADVLRAQRPHHPAPRPRDDVLVHRPGRRSEQAARGLAAHRAARLRRRAEGPGRVRLAGDGRLLRGRRADRRPRRRPLPPHRHPPDQPPPGGPARRPGRRGHHPPAGAVRVGFAPRWYVPARRCERSRAHPGRGPDVLPVQGRVQLLRHRRRAPRRLVLPGRLARGRGASPASSRSNRTRSTSTSTAARLRLEPGQSVIPHGVDRDLSTDEIAPRPT